MPNPFDILSLVYCPSTNLHNQPYDPLHAVLTVQRGFGFVIASAAKQSHIVVQQVLEIASLLRPRNDSDTRGGQISDL